MQHSFLVCEAQTLNTKQQQQEASQIPTWVRINRGPCTPLCNCSAYKLGKKRWRCAAHAPSLRCFHSALLPWPAAPRQCLHSRCACGVLLADCSVVGCPQSEGPMSNVSSLPCSATPRCSYNQVEVRLVDGSGAREATIQQATFVPDAPFPASCQASLRRDSARSNAQACLAAAQQRSRRPDLRKLLIPAVAPLVRPGPPQSLMLSRSSAAHLARWDLTLAGVCTRSHLAPKPWNCADLSGLLAVQMSDRGTG